MVKKCNKDSHMPIIVFQYVWTTSIAMMAFVFMTAYSIWMIPHAPFWAEKIALMILSILELFVNIVYLPRLFFLWFKLIRYGCFVLLNRYSK